MECPYCHASWESQPDVKLQICPFCGETLIADKNAKVSFDFTWGLVYEDQLKKTRDQKNISLFKQAYENFYKAFQEDPSTGMYFAGFLEKYPLEIPEMETLTPPEPYTREALQEAFPSLKSHDLAAVMLLLHAAKNHKDTAALRLLYELSQKENPDKILETILPGLGVTSESSPALRAAVSALQKQNGFAVQALKEPFKDSVLFILSPDVLEFYTGIPHDEEKRKEFVRAALEQPENAQTLDRVMYGLYRPLQKPEQEFDHLSELVLQALPYLKDHKEQWLARTKDLLDHETLLRGIHLVLQQIRNLDPDFHDIDPLLDLHYEKIYMQPYAKIQKSDYIL